MHILIFQLTRDMVASSCVHYMRYMSRLVHILFLLIPLVLDLNYAYAFTFYVRFCLSFAHLCANAGLV